MDVKCGNGAFMTTIDDARALGRDHRRRRRRRGPADPRHRHRHEPMPRPDRRQRARGRRSRGLPEGRGARPALGRGDPDAGAELLQLAGSRNERPRPARAPPRRRQRRRTLRPHGGSPGRPHAMFSRGQRHRRRGGPRPGRRQRLDHRHRDPQPRPRRDRARRRQDATRSRRSITPWASPRSEVSGGLCRPASLSHWSMAVIMQGRTPSPAGWPPPSPSRRTPSSPRTRSSNGSRPRVRP
jgi:hypothetical protein